MAIGYGDIGVNQGATAPAQVTTAGQATQAQGATAQDQLAGILDKGGALMQQAATTGNQQAASRGLLNSSMGIQAAQNAVIANAAPLAQSDANLIQNNQQFNAQATNQQNQWNAGAQNTGSQFNSQQQNAMNQWNAGQRNEMLNKIVDVNSREQLMNMEANYKTLMQANSSASGMYEQALKNMSDIQSSDKLDAYAKQTALNNQLTYLRSGMTMLQNMNGITGLVTF